MSERAKPVGRFDWERVILASGLPPRTRLVGLVLAVYADGADGRNVRPGISRLADDCSLPESTVRQHVTALRQLGYIERVRSGSACGRQGRADEYRLTIPHHRQPVSGDAWEDRQSASSDHEVERADDRQPASRTPPASQRITASQPASTTQGSNQEHTRVLARVPRGECGECEARPGDAPSARILADGRKCPRCHPGASVALDVDGSVHAI
jgi:hypothetical protein